MAMAVTKTLEMFQHAMGDIYDAEHRFLRGQQLMITKATDPQLQNLLKEHVEQTRQQIRNLEEVFSLLGQRPKGVTCESARGLVVEAARSMDEAATDGLRDFLIASAATKVEHYEIASYRGLVMVAELMEQDQIKGLLEQNLRQEEHAADLLERSAPQLLRKALLTQTTAGPVPVSQETVGTEPHAREQAGEETVVREPHAAGVGQIRPGMAVIGSHAGHVGRVKEVRTADFLVNRPARRDVYVPVDAIEEISGDTIVLKVMADDVDGMGWEKPAIT
jgi:ferritin-like metal-binding protein YciE